MNSDAAGAAAFGPWNPGLQSRIPHALAHLATIFRPDNVFTPFDQVRELSDLTGLDPVELVVFRPQRLALHEILVRVMADFSVPDGSRIEDLGINFRAIVSTILTQHVEPRMHVVTAAYEEAKSAVTARIDAELATLMPAPLAAAGAKRSWLAALFARPAPPSSRTTPHQAGIRTPSPAGSNADGRVATTSSGPPAARSPG